MQSYYYQFIRIELEVYVFRYFCCIFIEYIYVCILQQHVTRLNLFKLTADCRDVYACEERTTTLLRTTPTWHFVCLYWELHATLTTLMVFMLSKVLSTDWPSLVKMLHVVHPSPGQSCRSFLTCNLRFLKFSVWIKNEIRNSYIIYLIPNR